MQELDAAKPLRHAMHVDVSVGKGQATGPARRGPCGRRPNRDPSRQEHWTLSDRAGNRVCIAVWPDGDSTPQETAE